MHPSIAVLQGMDGRAAAQPMDMIEEAELADEGLSVGAAVTESGHLNCPGCHRGRHQRWHPGSVTAGAIDGLACRTVTADAL